MMPQVRRVLEPADPCAACADVHRPVNDQDFDVALHVVFRTRADHDRYQKSERHITFIEENKGNWKQSRVFDSYKT